jgi:hypothetical protein
MKAMQTQEWLMFIRISSILKHLSIYFIVRFYEGKAIKSCEK